MDLKYIKKKGYKRENIKNKEQNYEEKWIKKKEKESTKSHGKMFMKE